MGRATAQGADPFRKDRPSRPRKRTSSGSEADRVDSRPVSGHGGTFFPGKDNPRLIYFAGDRPSLRLSVKSCRYLLSGPGFFGRRSP